MASGSAAMREGCTTLLGLRCSCQASVKHFEQCAEFLPLLTAEEPLYGTGPSHSSSQRFQPDHSAASALSRFARRPNWPRSSASLIAYAGHRCALKTIQTTMG